MGNPKPKTKYIHNLPAGKAGRFYESEEQSHHSDGLRDCLAGFVKTEYGYVKAYSQNGPNGEAPHFPYPIYTKMIFIYQGRYFTKSLEKYCGPHSIIHEAKIFSREVINGKGG